MVGDGRKIKPSFQPGFYILLPIRIGKNDALTLGIAIGIPGVVALTRNIRIEEISAVDMEIPEEGSPLGIVVRTGLTCLGTGESFGYPSPESE